MNQAMKVSELIEALGKLDPELSVVVPRSDCSAYEAAVVCYEHTVFTSQMFEYAEPDYSMPDSKRSEGVGMRVMVIDMDLPIRP
jgi:hypothetical protein